MIRPLTFFLALALPFAVEARQHMVMTQGLTYSPVDLAADRGDTVVFMTSFSFHPTVEVSQATWNANGTAALTGGFSFTSGTEGTVILSDARTYYYVCTNHVGSGMKGQIRVTAVSSKPTLTSNAFRPYPNPATSQISLPAAAKNVRIVDGQGRVLIEQKLSNGSSPQLALTGLSPGHYVLFVDEQRYAIFKD